MSTATIPAGFFNNLAGWTMFQLTDAAEICNARCLAAPRGSRSDAIWLGRRDRVFAEIERRGWRIFRVAPDAPYVSEPRGATV